MKTLKDHTIFYDAVCPMCNAYTKAFIKTGMLDENGRGTYQEMPVSYAAKIDMQKAVNEIALLNKKTGTVHYGIDSMFLVFGNSFPVLKPLLYCRPFKWMAEKVYKFISYNRRVIIPSSCDGKGHAPAFHKGYRMAYLVFTWIITAFVLYNYSHLLNGVMPKSNFYREFLICGGQIFWQLFFISILNPGKRWDYLGNMMTISFAGGMMLLPALVTSLFADLNSIVYVFYFLMTAAFMLLEHIRRTKILGISYHISITWILYRIILLILIVYAE